MRKKIITTICLGILIVSGSFGIGIENVFATICNQTIKVEEKDGDSIYIKGVTIAARPDFGIIIIKCVTDDNGECLLEGLLEHTSYNIIVEQSILPTGYECDGSRIFDCETNIIACNPMKTFRLKKIATSELEPAPTPVFQVDNLVDLTSIDRCKTCKKVPCSVGSCGCATCGEGENTYCCSPCSCSDCTGQPCPMPKIISTFNNLERHYQNVESDYNIILKSFEQIKDIDAPSIKNSYRKINSIENINGWTVEDRNAEILEKLDYCRTKMNLCFSQLYEYEVIEKEEVVREILIPCQIGKDADLTGAENCYGFDFENINTIDRAENLLCYHHMGEIFLDELAEEEPEPEEPEEAEEAEEADVILGQIWLDIHKYTYETWCRDKNKKNSSNIGYINVDTPNKCCKRHYENSIDVKLIDTVRHPDANHYWEKYNCLGY